MKRSLFNELCAVGGSLMLLAVFAPPAPASDDKDDVGAVYTMTNDPQANAVLVFQRGSNGALTPGGTFYTGGRGTGGKEPDFGLGNARALVLGQGDRLLFVVNPGSDDVSVFEVESHGLRLLDRHHSGGHQPVSITVHGKLVYVLNAGGNDGQSDNITGFIVREDGRLADLPNSRRPLSAAATGPAEVRFSRDGAFLAVTERNTDKIDTYLVGHSGLLTGPVVNASDSQTPFGFDFGLRNEMFVADDFNDAIGQGAMSSYFFGANGHLNLVSGNVKAAQSGACWVLVSANGKYAYLTSTVSSAVSLYNVNLLNGQITHAKSYASPTNPTDMDFSRDGRFLYILNPDQTGSTPGITAYRVNPADGTLTAIPGVTGLPAAIDGIAAR